MYQGSRMVVQPYHRDQYFSGLGTRPVHAGLVQAVRHQYTCDHCGQVYQFVEPATEAFYCGSVRCHRNNLVSIEEEA